MLMYLIPDDLKLVAHPLVDLLNTFIFMLVLDSSPLHGDMIMQSLCHLHNYLAYLVGFP